MPDVEGRITIVQESRFQLTDDHGVSHLLVLSPHASAEPEQLLPLAARQARVRVRVSDAPNIIGRLAESVRVQEREGGR